MDTFEARQRMKDLASEGLELLNRFLCGESSMLVAAEQARRLSSESRTVLMDAGYPGESTWRALQRAANGLSVLGDAPPPEYLEEVKLELTEARDALNRLLAVGAESEADFRIVS